MRTSGSYYESEKDVVTEVVGKGNHHGGCTRLVFNVISSTQCLFSQKKRKSNKDQRLQEEIKVVQQNHHHVDTEAEILFFYNIQLLYTDSLQQSIALNQQAPQHSGDYSPLM
ncbi:hypothetical protein R6Q57_018248, partial [Mikania cordata]